MLTSWADSRSSRYGPAYGGDRNVLGLCDSSQRCCRVGVLTKVAFRDANRVQPFRFHQAWVDRVHPIFFDPSSPASETVIASTTAVVALYTAAMNSWSAYVQ